VVLVMVEEGREQEVEAMGDDPAEPAEADGAGGRSSSGSTPLPVRSKTDKTQFVRDDGPRVASPLGKPDPRFEAASRRMRRQEAFLAEQARLKDEQLATDGPEDDLEADQPAKPSKSSFSFNMTGERREPEE
jgi:hypothetical protein